MQQTPDTDEELPQSTVLAQNVGAADSASGAVSPARELSELLGRAGALAASMSIELDAWMKAAWSAYVDAQPGLREHLEDMHLIAQLTKLHQSGRMGKA
jgi:hypothetical protein